MSAKKYLIRYRCQICGELFSTGNTTTLTESNPAARTVSHKFCHTMMQNLIKPMLNIDGCEPYVIHDCSSGSVGIAIIAGAEVIE